MAVRLWLNEVPARVSFDLALDKQDFPKMQASLVFGSPEVRWDVSNI